MAERSKRSRVRCRSWRACAIREPARTGRCRLSADLAKPDWSRAEPAKLEPAEEFPALASSGVNPVNGAPTLVLGSPASPPRYEASLKVATVIVALDKSATGLNAKNHLTEVTSQYLALMANVAAIYENQLGVRLLVQELILTPDSDDYEDIPFDSNGGTLDDVRGLGRSVGDPRPATGRRRRSVLATD